jgi:hypothetical protein
MKTTGRGIEIQQQQSDLAELTNQRLFGSELKSLNYLYVYFQVFRI